MTQTQVQQDQARRYGQLVAAAWADPELKQRLLTSPGAVFAEQGIDLPSGVEPRVVENTDQTTYFVLPRQPSDGELSDEQLRRLPGGYAPCAPSDVH